MRDIRVLVTDDSAIIRRLISDLVNSEPGMSVVGVAQNGRSQNVGVMRGVGGRASFADEARILRADEECHGRPCRRHG